MRKGVVAICIIITIRFLLTLFSFVSRVSPPVFYWSSSNTAMTIMLESSSGECCAIVAERQAKKVDKSPKMNNDRNMQYTITTGATNRMSQDSSPSTTQVFQIRLYREFEICTSPFPRPPPRPRVPAHLTNPYPLRNYNDSSLKSSSCRQTSHLAGLVLSVYRYMVRTCPLLHLPLSRWWTRG